MWVFVMADKVRILRDAIGHIDTEILDLIFQRQTLARELGKLKQQMGLPVRNCDVEQSHIVSGLLFANTIGLSADLTREVIQLLIKHAAIAQEEDRKSQPSKEEGPK